MSQPLSIRIRGAGVTGLAAATALAADGHHIELIDERFQIPTVGTSLGMFGSTQRAVARLGVLDEVRRISVTRRQGSIHGRDDRSLATLPAGAALLLARSGLARILQEALLGVLGLFSAVGSAETPASRVVPEG